MKIIESLRNFFTQKNIKELCKKIWGKEPEPVDESVFDDPDRYVKFDEWKDKHYWEDKKRYKREKRLLTLRRFCVSVISIWLLFQLTTGFIKSVSLFVKTNEFLSCIGKDACIYLGPKTNYYLTPVKSAYRASNNNIYKISFCRPSIGGEYKTDFCYEYYDVKKNKFIKMNAIGVKDIEPYVITEDMSKNPVFITSNNPVYSANNPIYSFNLKTQKFQNSDKYFLKTTYINNSLSLNYLYVADYLPNYLIFENKIKKFFGGDDRQVGNNTYLSKEERLKYQLYLYNVEKNFLTKLPKLPQSVKHMPLPADFIVLDNGKMIVPIRYRNDKISSIQELFSENLYAKLESILVYDPTKNAFYNLPPLKEMEHYLFYIKLPNNDVVFITENYTYTFNNKTNQFSEVSSQEKWKNRKTIAKLKNVLQEHLGIKIEEFSQSNAVNIVPLSKYRFLITCGSMHLSYAPLNLKAKEIAGKACLNTVIYDYKKDKVKLGPKLLRESLGAKFFPYSDNKDYKVMIIGGFPTSDKNTAKVTQNWIRPQIIKFR